MEHYLGCIVMSGIESSQIESYGYHKPTSTLRVRFKSRNNLPGSVYQYNPLPVEVYAALIEAESAGKFLNASIKGKYPTVQLPEEQVNGVWRFTGEVVEAAGATPKPALSEAAAAVPAAVGALMGQLVGVATTDVWDAANRLFAERKWRVSQCQVDGKGRGCKLRVEAEGHLWDATLDIAEAGTHTTACAHVKAVPSV